MVELLWEGKYDSGGHRKAPLKVALPFQTVETVNESAQQRQHALDLFAASRDSEWRNRLIWGDKKYVLPALLNEFAGRINLIYIDPPFATGQDFSLPVRIIDDEFVKPPSVIEVKAYRDTWAKGLDSYLAWFHDMATYFRELLAETGSLFVHLDPGVSHYVKTVLDSIFGMENFRNEIVWKRKAGRGETNAPAIRFGVTADVILFYAKGSSTRLRRQYRESNVDYIASKFVHQGPDGRRYRLDNITSPSFRQNLVYEYKGHLPPPKGWAVSRERMEAMDAEGRLFIPDDPNRRIQRKRYLDELEGETVDSLWDDIPPINSQAVERVGYPTQKPESLLQRIIESSTDPGDLVLDCVCGSGTTAVVAEKLGRRWIASDLGRFAIHTTRKRLLRIENVTPFEVQNLGKYERQLWQEAEFGKDAGPRTAAYRKLILDLYHATPVEGYVWLQGVKAGAMVHVGSVDAPVTMSDVTNVIAETRKVAGSSIKTTKTPAIDVLGWDFAFEVHEVASQKAAEANIALRFVRIPREVLDKRAVEQGDVAFFELAALAVDVKVKRRIVSLMLTDFVIPVDDVPDDVQRTIKKWSEWIDYWAVDWDNKGDAFHNEWQAFRSRNREKLEVQTSNEYPAPGTYRVVVKVIDILGNDTTKSLDIEVM